MNHPILLILAVTIITCFGINEACKKNVVEIRNELGQGQNLQFHCRSKDNDLGIKTMQFKTTPYQIRFYDEVINLTTWNCLLRQGTKMEYSFDIEVYKAGPRVFPRCGQLRIWSARPDGIYFARNAKDPLERALAWNKG